MAGIRIDHPFTLTRGGPFFHVLTRSHLVDPRGRVRLLWIVLAVWLPIVVASLMQLAFTGHVDAVLRDPTVHVRLLVTMPLVFAAGNLLDARCEGTVRRSREEGLAERASLDAILDRAEHLRDSRFVEIAIAVVVFVLGQAALWGVAGWSVPVSGRHAAVELSFGTIWFLGFALPLVQFVLFRWLWQWAIWAYVLARLSRLPLAMTSLHPDQAGGLRLLSHPIDAFAVFNVAIGSLASAAWMTQIFDHKMTIEALTPIFIAAFVVETVLACGPLLLFFRKIYRVRQADVEAYHVLAREYVDEFRDKWLRDHPGEQVLGTGDIQSLNDLGGAYEKTEGTRLFPFNLRSIIYLWAGALAPMVPLILATQPLSQVAAQFGKMMFGLGK
jgi:hypothetical protein